MIEPFFAKYFYLVFVALIAPLWLIIFIVKKHSRMEMIYLGLMLGSGAMLVDRYCSFYDYWRPPLVFGQALGKLNVESFLYGFFVCGICTKIHEFVSGREYPAVKTPRSWIIYLLVAAYTVGYVGFLLAAFINSLHILNALMLITFIVFVFITRRALIGLVSGAIMVGVNILWYGATLALYPDAIRDVWLTKNLSGIALFGVPIEEHMFIFLLGATGSVGYKILTGTPLTGGLRKNDPGLNPGRNMTGQGMEKRGIGFSSYICPLIITLISFGYIILLGDSGRFQVNPVLFRSEVEKTAPARHSACRGDSSSSL